MEGVSVEGPLEAYCKGLWLYARQVCSAVNRIGYGNMQSVTFKPTETFQIIHARGPMDGVGNHLPFQNQPRLPIWTRNDNIKWIQRNYIFRSCTGSTVVAQYRCAYLVMLLADALPGAEERRERERKEIQDLRRLHHGRFRIEQGLEAYDEQFEQKLHLENMAFQKTRDVYATAIVEEFLADTQLGAQRSRFEESARERASFDGMRILQTHPESEKDPIIVLKFFAFCAVNLTLLVTQQKQKDHVAVLQSTWFQSWEILETTRYTAEAYIQRNWDDWIQLYGKTGAKRIRRDYKNLRNFCVQFMDKYLFERVTAHLRAPYTARAA